MQEPVFPPVFRQDLRGRLVVIGTYLGSCVALRLKKFLLHKIIKSFLVLLAYRDALIAEKDAVAFDGFNLFQVDDVGAVYPHETIRWQFCLQGFHGGMKDKWS